MHSPEQSTLWRSIRRRGFTLVELLTVIAIIGVLVAILIPVAGSAREKVRKARCTSNLHQIGIALIGYAMDHKGRLPAGWLSEGRTLMEKDPNNSSVKNPAGLGALQYLGYISGPTGVVVSGSARSPLFDCPTRTESGWDSYSNWSDYWYNFTGSHYEAGGALLNTLPAGRAIVYDVVSLDASVAAHDDGKSANVLYADGSVRSFSKPQFKSSDRNTCFNL